MTQNEAPAPAETTAPPVEPTAPATEAPPVAPAPATENTQSPPPAAQSEAQSEAPPLQRGTPRPAPARLFTIRDIAPNEFRVFDMTSGGTEGKAVGKVLTPQDAAVVLGWLDSLNTEA